MLVTVTSLSLCVCVCVFKESYFVSDLVIPLLKRVHEAMNRPGVSAKLKDVLQQVSAYDNVPRKKAKFQVGITSICTYNLCCTDHTV